MTKTLSVAAAAIIFALGLLVWFQERRIVGLNRTVTKLEAVRAACQAQARIYGDWEKIDHGVSQKIKKMVGDGPAAVVGALNELFGKKSVPAAPGPAGHSGPARPPVRAP
jgi:hypothetical protein